MDQIVVDPVTAQQLRQKQDSLKLVDRDGNLIGHFFPVTPTPEEPPISEEELERREQEPGRSLAEILADLEKRA